MATFSSIQDYVTEILKQWLRRSGNDLQRCFSLRDAHVACDFIRNFENETISSCIDPPLSDLVITHLNCALSFTKGNIRDVHFQQSSLVKECVKLFETQDNQNWMLPVIYTICKDLRLITKRLELFGIKDVEDFEMQPSIEKIWDETSDSIMNACKVCFSDSNQTLDTSKKVGTMTLANELLKIYLNLRKINLINPLQKMVEANSIDNTFKLSEVVTYKYLTGCAAIYYLQHKEAEQNLSFAFRYCHKSSFKNKKLILTYLVPIKLLLGEVPKENFLEKYDLVPLQDVANAVKYGRLNTFDKMLIKHGQFFLDFDIWMTILQLELMVFRNLYKKVHSIFKCHVLELSVLVVACQLERPHIDKDEVTCILTRLISKGLIKAYISEPHQKVVFSKINPFPKMTEPSLL